MRARSKPAKRQKRRTTLTLPSETLAHAETLARARGVNLSTVVAQALAEGPNGKRGSTQPEGPELVPAGISGLFGPGDSAARRDHPRAAAPVMIDLAWGPFFSIPARRVGLLLWLAKPVSAVESSRDRQARWRFDVLIAATALTLRMIHNNAGDFEAIRSAVKSLPQRFPRLGALELTRCTSLA
jgi:hypothetical protein